MRPRTPPCYHGDPYPAFYLGVPGGPLQNESWLDLRPLDDFDARDIISHTANGICRRVLTLDGALFR